MNKSIKMLIIMFIVAALIVPMFISCDGETPIDYKAEFLGKLSTEVGKLTTGYPEVIESADFTNNKDFEIEFKEDATEITNAASGFVDAINGISGVTAGKLKLTTIGTTEYSIKVPADLTALKTALINHLKGQTGPDVTLNYTASVTYKGQTFSLSGEVELKSVPDDFLKEE